MRSVNVKQKAEYIGGSKAEGFYEYSLEGIETSGNRIAKQWFELIGQGTTREEAIKAAWDEAKKWENEIIDQILERESI